MSDNMQDTIFDEDNQEEEIKHLVLKYAQYWRWFVVGVIIALVLAFLYNQYSTSIFKTSAQIKILEQDDNGLDLSGLEGAGNLLSMDKVNLENEIEVLSSRRLLDSVVNSLHLNTLYFKESGLKTSEIWKNKVPFLVTWQAIDSTLTEELPSFALEFQSPNQFTVRVVDGDTATKATFNKPVSLANFRFVITENPTYEKPLEEPAIERYLFQWTPEAQAIDRLLNNLMITQVGEDSDILSITYKGSIPYKNETIVDSLISKFNQDGIRDKQLVSKRTARFVEKRLHLLANELDTVETGLVNYKQTHDFVTIESTTKQLLAKETTSEQERIKLQTQKELVTAFKETLVQGEDYALLPTNIGIESEAVNTLTGKYNELVLERNNLMTSATLKNPVVQQLDTKLRQIKGSILESINAYIQSLSLSLENFNAIEQQSSGDLRKVPKKAMGIRGIVRQREIKENLYLFLLQKREETALKYAVIVPSIKVVDYAYTEPQPVAPKTKVIYLAGLVLGLLIPFGFLYTRFLFDTKINNIEDLERLLPGVTILSEIPQLSKNAKKLIEPNDNSILAEAFRILRTNLNFLIVNKGRKEGSHVIFVTSTIKGEGKTFIALNTAHTLAATGNKTLIIGCDLRNPQTHKYYDKDKNKPGVSSYLSDESVSLKDLVYTGDKYFENLDLVTSGAIPPNPAELLMNGRFGTLIEEARQLYDYVIVDTAPTILVTDTLLIAQYADVNIYATRANHTEQKLLKKLKILTSEGKLKNVGIVLNGLDQNNRYGYSYNYGYGYGYSEDVNSPWWQFWKK